MSSERWRQRLRDIVENIEAIELYLEEVDYDAFIDNRMIIDASERCLQRITEAAIKIGEQRMKEIAPSTPLHSLRSFGNVLRHDYDYIDHRLIFNTIRNELPPLKRDCISYLDRMDP